VGTTASEAAKRRWASVDPKERRANVARASAAAAERRRVAHALLASVEAAGLRVTLEGDENRPAGAVAGDAGGDG
jgi:hypothetical protein